MSRRLTTLFSLFCIALIAWFLARATFALRETALETSGSASRLAENAAAAPEPLAAFDGITTRNLLGVSVFPPEAHRSLKSGTDADSGEENGLLSTDGIDALPVSKQGWKLLGTIVNTGPGKASRAVIQVNGAEQPYREGDTIQGWKIALVQRRTVVVAKGGSKERLLMSEDPILQKEDTKPDEQKTVSRARLREELGVGVVALDELFRITQETEHAVIRLRFIRTVLPEGEAVTPLEGQSFGWFDLKEPMPPDLLAPDRPVWEFLAE